MDPNGAGFQAMDSEDGTASAHALEWVERLGEGAHIIRIEQRVGNAATTFVKDDWTSTSRSTSSRSHDPRWPTRTGHREIGDPCMVRAA